MVVVSAPGTRIIYVESTKVLVPRLPNEAEAEHALDYRALVLLYTKPLLRPPPPIIILYFTVHSLRLPRRTGMTRSSLHKILFRNNALYLCIRHGIVLLPPVPSLNLPAISERVHARAAVRTPCYSGVAGDEQCVQRGGTAQAAA
eukprot:6171921-Pleurochrysis_carterae.AAC.1